MGSVIYPLFLDESTMPIGGTAIGKLATGSKVKMRLKGKDESFTIVQQGKPSSLYDQSCDGAWCWLDSLYKTMAFYPKPATGKTDYANSEIGKYLNGDFINDFDPEIRNILITATVQYNSGLEGNWAIRNVSAKAFLLSVNELGATQDIFWQYGTPGKDNTSKLDYFLFGNTEDAKNLRKAASIPSGEFPYDVEQPRAVAGESATWKYTVPVLDSGRISSLMDFFIYDACWIRPCVILPSSALVDKDGNLIGG